MLLTSASTGLATGFGRPVALAGLPTFNLDNEDFIVSDVDGWDATAKPDAVFVANGGGAGVVAAGPWLSQESYLTVTGTVILPLGQQSTVRQQLLAAVAPATENQIIVYGVGDEPDMQAFVRLYDKPDFVRNELLMQFTLPLLQADPFKYGLVPLVGSVGVYTGQTWYETYSQPSTTWVETYSGSGGTWWETFQQAIATGPYPDGLTLTSTGDAASRRGTITVTGPLTLGDWWLLNEATGDRLWADVALDVGQAMTFDCHTELATIAGADITSLVGGDWLTLEPGGNLYRLVAGSQSNAFATYSFLEANR